MSNYLFDKEFLRQLDQAQHKEKYARITTLTFQEEPIERITGRVTAGSINIDGDSAVRRTCNLTLTAKELNINEFYWGLNSKILLEIGIKNNINSKYPDIIWFKQGIFIITNFNTSITTNNYTVTISGKDKMCLLNGEIGGNLPASIDFGQINTYDDIYQEITFSDKTDYKANTYYINTGTQNNPVYKISNDEYNQNTSYYQKLSSLNISKLELRTIIKEAVHTYGNELYSNIIINDLEDYGLELLEYRGEDPMYLLYDKKMGIYTNMTLNGEQKCYVVTNIGELNKKNNYNEWKPYVEGKESTTGPIKLSEIVSNSSYKIYNSIDGFDSDATTIVFSGDNSMSQYHLRVIEYGETAGYRRTSLVYSGELVSSIGETLVSILDKIKNMLGDFEYFYDIDGRFVFQRKKTYINTSWNSLINTQDDIYAETLANSSSTAYSFIDNNLITAFSNNPVLNNLKNDYSVWGVRKGTSGADIPIHMRYAIDIKPKIYKGYDEIIYCADKETYNNLQMTEYRRLLLNYKNQLDNFILRYEVPSLLEQPVKNNDSSLSGGWWDIRDWYSYYTILNMSAPTDPIINYNGEDNKKTVSYFVLKNYLKSIGINAQAYFSNTQYCWLIGIDKSNKRVYFYDKSNEINEIDMNYLVNLLNNNSGLSIYIYDPIFPTITSFNEKITALANSSASAQTNNNVRIVDWREIIYQMALDYYAHNEEDNFLNQIAKNNIIKALNDKGIPESKSYYPTGLTGYEQYYTDMQGFWRQLYNTSPEITYPSSGGYFDNVKKNIDDPIFEYVLEWIEYELDQNNPQCDYFTEGDNKYWNKNVINSPQNLNFWFDFLDTSGDLSKYTVSAIGDRAKVVNDNNVTSIYFKETANMIFVNGNNYKSSDNISGYTTAFITSAMENLFTISSQGKSAKEVIDDLLYNNSYCTESVTITSIPIYYLEPNVRIFVRDDNSQINGDYIISRITLPLAYNGTMSITATKAVERLY